MYTGIRFGSEGRLNHIYTLFDLNSYEIDVIGIAEDYVHILVGFPSRDSISEVVQRLKGISAREIFGKYPEVKKELWGGEFWGDGYFLRTVMGDKVTKEVPRKYIEYHRDHEKSPQQQYELF